ncbi:hypothetical protein ACFZ8E_15085 [Methylobacterium sp. HMF5984]|uniref:hypothetical protein n=1 Tax=Methylobacterium sp. HMF5984 TaxID=3367370 RepID=UPI003854AC70
MRMFLTCADFVRPAFTIALGALLAGCAIPPLPEDVTGLDSYQISRQISCETREAVIDSTITFLSSERNKQRFETNDPKRPFIRLDDHSFAIGKELANNRDSIKSFDPKRLTGNARAIIGLLWGTGVAYTYDLEMTELNANGISINLLDVFTRSTRALGLNASADFQRQNTELFTASTTLGKMVTGPLSIICKPGYLADKNYLYPMAGNIGMREVIFNFVQLSIFGNLTGDVSKDLAAPAGPTKIARQLQFTTTLDFSVAPKVTFMPLKPGLRVMDASFTGQAKRVDLHKLTVGLFAPTKGLLTSTQNSVLGSLLGGPFTGIVSAPASGSAAEEGAVRAVNELLVLKIFQQRRDLPLQ